MRESRMTRLGVTAFVTAFLLIGAMQLFAAPSRAVSGWQIRDDATGGDCTQIGTWDGTTKTCTLTSDPTQTIVIGSDGITLDGAGHSISTSAGPSGICVAYYSGLSVDAGICASSQSGISIRNVHVSGFSCGVCLYSSTNDRLETNVITATLYGVVIQYYQGIDIGNDTVTGNTITVAQTTPYTTVGIYIAHFSQYDQGTNTISANAVAVSNAQGAGVGVELSNSPAEFIDSVISGSYYGVFLDGFAGTFGSNSVTGGFRAIEVEGSNIVLSGNTASGGGIGLFGSFQGGVVSGNTLSGGFSGVYASCVGCTLSGNSVSGGTFGMFLGVRGGTASGNAISGSYYDMYLPNSDPSTVIGAGSIVIHK